MCEEYLEDKKGTVTLIPFKEYYLQPGDAFNIELKENHFSSFRWHLTEYDNDIISLVLKDRFDPYPNDLLGRKKIVLWKFRSFYRGKIQLIFELYRPWEGVSSSVEQLIYHINVIQF